MRINIKPSDIDFIMRDHLTIGILCLILLCAFTAALYARKAAQVKPVLVRELIVIVDSGEDAERVLEVMKDVLTVD